MSSSKLDRAIPVEDLSIGARRGTLSDADQRKFEHVLASDPALRVGHEVGRSFDAISGVRVGDEALFARLADRVLAPSSTLQGRRTTSPHRRLAWGLGLAAVLASSVAAAWYSGAIRPRVAAPSVPLGETLTVSEAPLSAPVSMPRLDVRAVPSAPPIAPATHLAAAPQEKARVEGETAADVFRRANAARRAADFSAASEFYRTLEANFPRSDEARLAHVSFGKILLASGKATEAERQFSAYLEEGSRDLTEEALMGRAESLGRLGRRTEETQTWQRLLRDFPASVYATRAKQRLDEIHSGPH